MFRSPNAVQDAIKGAWTRGAHAYDHDAGHGLATPAVERAWSDVLEDALDAAPLDVLDVGTGTGLLAVIAAKLGHRVTGVDFTPAMLERGAHRAERAGVHVAWCEGDGMDLPFRPDSFDAVVSRHVLWTLTDPAAAFREWVRVTRPGGRVVWFDGLYSGGWQTKLRGGLARTLRWLQRRPDHAGSHGYPDHAIEALPLRGIRSPEPVRALLHHLGIDDATFEHLTEVPRAEQHGEPLHKRVAGVERRYMGTFHVTAELKRRFGPSSERADSPSD